MNQVSQKFGTNCRIWTIAFAFILAFFVQIDTFQLLKRLSADPQHRAQLIALSSTLERSYQSAVANQSAAKTAAPASADQAWQETTAAINDVKAKANEVNQMLGEAQFDLLPPLCDLAPAGPTVKLLSFGYFQQWPNWFSGKMHLAGLLVTGVLLSLGAPFWFNTLKNLLSLRSTVAQAADSSPTQPVQTPATAPAVQGNTATNQTSVAQAVDSSATQPAQTSVTVPAVQGNTATNQTATGTTTGTGTQAADATAKDQAADPPTG